MGANGQNGAAHDDGQLGCPCCGVRLDGERAVAMRSVLAEEARDLALAPPDPGTLYIDPHAHMISRTTDDYAAMAAAGVVALIEPSFWLGQPRTNAGSYADYLSHIVGFERFRASQFGIKHFCTIGLNPKEANDPALAEAVMELLPLFAVKEGVVAIGELGYDDQTAEEDKYLRAQIELAREVDLPIMIHTPHRDKKRGTARTLDSDGRAEVLLDDLRQPVNGLTWHDGAFLIAEGGAPGRISRWRPGHDRETVLDGLPARGNYHTNMVVPGPDGWLYFSQGAMTNSGVVGLDAYQMAWLKMLPHPYDVPGYDITLTGETFETPDPLAEAQPASARTAAFAPFGQNSEAAGRIAGRVPCTASVMRCRPDGSGLELVAWGLRNAYGLGFLPDGRLLATDQGADDRGSRPIGQAPDLLHVVEQGRWYGWPDFIGDRPVTDAAFVPERGPRPRFLLSDHHALPPPEPAVLEFPANISATKFAVVPPSAPRWGGKVVVACFGDEKPVTASPGPRVGRGLLRIDPADWSQTPIAGPAFHRPIDVLATPDGRTLLVLDFGRFEMLGEGRMDATAGSGSVWSLSLA